MVQQAMQRWRTRQLTGRDADPCRSSVACIPAMGTTAPPGIPNGTRRRRAPSAMAPLPSSAAASATPAVPASATPELSAAAKAAGSTNPPSVPA